MRFDLLEGFPQRLDLPIDIRHLPSNYIFCTQMGRIEALFLGSIRYSRSRPHAASPPLEGRNESQFRSTAIGSVLQLVDRRDYGGPDVGGNRAVGVDDPGYSGGGNSSQFRDVLYGCVAHALFSGDGNAAYGNVTDFNAHSSESQARFAPIFITGQGLFGTPAAFLALTAFAVSSVFTACLHCFTIE